MSQGGGMRWSKASPGTMVLGALLCVLSLSLFGCGASEDSNNARGYFDPDDYALGGQTGSLIPGCGVAPLSASGSSVPAGEVLAVLYTRECSDPPALRLALDGAGAVELELVPLDESGVYLVRSERSLPAGEYELSYDQSESGLRVDAAAPDLPRSVGPLHFLTSDAACSEQLRFELELDDAVLAYAPLSRFMLRLDGGAEQLWIDYGALPIETDEDGSRGVLELPRCSQGYCLEDGPHRLELSMSIAGEVLTPDPFELDFSVDCPSASPAGADDVAAFDSVGSNSGCSLSVEKRRGFGTAELMGAACLTGLALRRRSKQRPAATAR